MGWLRKRGNRYHVEYRDESGKVLAASSHSRKLDADRALRALETSSERVAGFDPRRGRIPNSEWAVMWLATKHDIKPKTRAGYESLLRSRVLPTFGAVSVNQITPAMVDTWVAEMVSEGLSPTRVRQAHQVLSSMMKAALRRGLIAGNPTDGTPLPAPVNRDQRFLSPNELASFCGAMPSRLQASAWVLGVAGLRFGEMAALTRDDIDILRRRIHVRRSVTEVNGRLVIGTPKNGKTRSVAIPATLARILNEQMLSHPHDVVFPDTAGGMLRVNNYRKYVVAACDAVGLETIRTHDLRHTAASLMLAAEPDVFIAMKQLGHSSISVTVDVYGHLLPGRVDDAADKLDTLIASGIARSGADIAQIG
jgi:integrase